VKASLGVPEMLNVAAAWKLGRRVKSTIG